MKKYFFILLGLLLAACAGTKIANQNLSYLYNPLEVLFIPDYCVFNDNDSITTVYLTLNTKNLLYIKNENTQRFEAHFSAQALLYDSYEMKTMIDSCYTEFKNDDNVNYYNFWGNFKVRAKFPGNYLLKVVFRDLNRHTEVESYVDIYKSQRYSSQSFLLTDKDSFPLIPHYIIPSQQFRIFSGDTAIKSLFIRCYDRSFPIALPPYSTTNLKPFDFTPDSLFEIPIHNGYSELLSFKNQGIYHLQVDTTLKQGCSVFCFDEDYPAVTNPIQMLYSLRYLSSKSEYDDLLVMKSKKEAVEQFWLETGGSVERAKELIKLYYNRVQQANKLFYSYLEGWKTDRGLIYIVYGPPNVVYRSEKGESWVYGEDRNLSSISFSFYKVENPFTENDYALSRSPIYKDGWYIAVDNWRR
jgi:GWxTD domain-containing protein